jgi:hypothetical protein
MKRQYIYYSIAYARNGRILRMKVNNGKQIMLVSVLAVIVIGLCLATGCTDSQVPNVPGTGAHQTTAPTQAGQAATGTPAPGSVKAVHFNSLIPFLPAAPAGWEADEATGMTMKVENDDWSWATKEYTKGDATAMVWIQDTAYYNVGFREAWGSMISFETTDGYFKSVTVKGYPSWESYSKSGSEYISYVDVADRFMVYVGVDDGTKADLDAFTGAIDYAGLSKLK